LMGLQTASDEIIKTRTTAQDLTGQRQNQKSPAGHAAWHKADRQRAGVQLRGKCKFKGECTCKVDCKFIGKCRFKGKCTFR